MKKSAHKLEKERLFFGETAEEFFPEEWKKRSSTQHRERLKGKEKNFSKNLKSEKSGENES